jgi:hypothetical protein
VNISTTRSLFTDSGADPVVLGLVLLKVFGAEYLGWEPDTLWREIELTWRTAVAEANKTKIHAVRTCHVTDAPYEHWEIFEKVCAGLHGFAPRFDLMQKPTPHAAAVSLVMMDHIRDYPVSDEVYKYIAASAADYGMVYCPDRLTPCNKFLARIVPEETQRKVSVAYRSKRVPTFDGKNKLDAQIMKTITVADVLHDYNKRLKRALDKVRNS